MLSRLVWQSAAPFSGDDRPLAHTYWEVSAVICQRRASLLSATAPGPSAVLELFSEFQSTGLAFPQCGLRRFSYSSCPSTTREQKAPSFPNGCHSSESVRPHPRGIRCNRRELASTTREDFCRRRTSYRRPIVGSSP